MVSKLTFPTTQNQVLGKVNEIIDDKQDNLVSGTNIKTINGNSLLGSGDITISGGGSYTAGTGIDITNNTVSVTAPTVINTATGGGVLTILGTPTNAQDAMNIGKGTSVSGSYSFCIGINSNATGASAFCIGRNARAVGSASMAMGLNAEAQAAYSVAIGRLAIAAANSAIQIGYGTNSIANSLAVGFYNNTSTYTLLDGTTGLIPTARLADTTSATQGQVLTLDSNLKAVWANGGGGSYIAGDGIDITNNTISLGDIDCGTMV